MSFAAPLRVSSRSSRRNNPNETGDEVSEESGPSEKEFELEYQPPRWARPSEKSYFLEVLKQGVVLDPIEIPCGRDFILCGRASECDICMEHPSISRFHCVLQFGPGNECTLTIFLMVSVDGKLFIFDLGSTHGTFLNKQRIPARQFVGWEVGSLLKLGESTRWYIIQAREELSDGAKREQDEEITGRLSSMKRLFLDPITTLRSWFQECGQVMRLERISQYPNNQDQEQLVTLRIVLPPVVESISEEVVVEASGTTRKEVEFNVCMAACEKLKDLGELQPDIQDQEEFSSREWKRHRQEALEEEQETFFDQSLVVSEKADQSQLLHTLSSLRERHRQLSDEIAQITEQLAYIDAHSSHLNANDEDDLDSYLEGLRAQQASEDRARLTFNLRQLEEELRKVKLILVRVDPSFDDRGFARVTPNIMRKKSIHNSRPRTNRLLAPSAGPLALTHVKLTEEDKTGVKGARRGDDDEAQEDFEDLHPEVSEDNQETKNLISKYGY